MMAKSARKAKSCGQCRSEQFTELALLGKKFGKLSFVCYTDRHAGRAEALWRCDCGGEKLIVAQSVVNGYTKSCGCLALPVSKYHGEPKQMVSLTCVCGKEFQVAKHERRRKKCGACNDRSFAAGAEFGKLTLLSHETLQPYAERLIPVRCACGWVGEKRAGHVLRGLTASCGQCAVKALPEIRPTGRVSKAAFAMQEAAKLRGFDVVLEHPVETRQFDLFIKDTNTVIEHHGLRYHGGLEKHRKDLLKHKLAEGLGYRSMAVFSDEWSDRPEAITELIAPRKAMNRKRPQQLVFGEVKRSETVALLEQYHYLGQCRRASKCYALFDGANMVCVATFARPSRQGSGDWELTRMIRHPDWSVPGCWGYLMKRVPCTGKIVTFSENRLFSGASYEKIGFTLERDVEPDYTWSNGNKRWHKSKMRKKPGEVGTESELRHRAGLYKVYDYGKRKWSMFR